MYKRQDPNVVDRHIQFSTAEGCDPDVVSMSDQLVVRDANMKVGIDTPTGVKRGVRARGRKTFVQPMGVAQFDRSGSGVFSAPMGAQDHSGNLLSPRVAMEGDKGPVVQREIRAPGGVDGTDAVNCATSRVASGLGRHEYGAATPSDVADCPGESSAGTNVVASGHSVDEPSAHVGSAALPSDNVVANQGADCNLSGAHRIADLPDDSMSWGHISSNCTRARGTAECRTAAGNIPDIVEQHTAAGDSRSSDTCAGFPPYDSVVTERPVIAEGAVTPNSVISPGVES